MICRWHGVYRNHILNLPFGRFQGINRPIFAEKCRYRPADIRFGQFEVCGTSDYVLQSHVTSFGVGVPELPEAWRFPQPYMDIAVTVILGRHFRIFSRKCLSRPVDIRFGQFKACGTCDYVVQSHVTSFGVRFHKLLMARRLPYPYIELAVWAYLGNFQEFSWNFCQKMPILARRHSFWLIQSVWPQRLCCSKPCYKFWTRITRNGGCMAFPPTIY